jgi:MscS family membrane protein
MRFWIVGLLSCLFCWSGLAQAKPENCDNPRSAADMVFYWQQPGTTDLGKAASCFERGRRSTAELERLAKTVKSLYDTRGLFIDMDAISDQPDYKSDRGEQRVAVHPAMPDIVVKRNAGGKWVWPDSSLKTAEKRYSEEAGLLQPLLDRIPDSLTAKLFGVHLWQYLGLVGLILLGFILRAVVRVVIANRVRRLAETLGQEWASNLATTAAGPLSTLVMAVALRVTYPMLMLPVAVAVVLAVAVRILMVLAIVWGLYRLVDLLAERMDARAAQTDTKLDDQLVPLVRKSLKIFVAVGGVLFILQNLQVDVGSLLTGLGIGGLAFALAAKETLANFFGSVMIFIDRPFQIGDWIVVGGTEGIVEEVGFRSTRIRTFYNSLVTVPNATFTDAEIDNYGQREYRRTFTTLNLTYDTTAEQMQAFCEGIRAIIVANPYTRKDYYEVHMSGFGAHSLDVMVYFFFKVPSWTVELRERHNVYLEIMRLAQELGVEFAFPTQTLYLDSVAAPGQARRVPPAKQPPQLAEVVSGFGPDGRLARPAGPQIIKGGFTAASRAAGSEDGE